MAITRQRLARSSAVEVVHRGLAGDLLLDPAQLGLQRVPSAALLGGQVAVLSAWFVVDGAQLALPPLMRCLSSLAPLISLRVLELGLAEYEDALDCGIADLAIGRVKLADTFRSELILASRYVAIMSAGHELLKRKHAASSLDYDSYLRARHVSVVPRGATGNPIDKALGKDLRARRIALAVPHTTVLSTVIPGTDLIATVPDTCIEALCGDGRMDWMELSFEIDTSFVFQWWHKRQDVDAGHRWLREQVVSLHGRERVAARHERPSRKG